MFQELAICRKGRPVSGVFASILGLCAWGVAPAVVRAQTLQEQVLEQRGLAGPAAPSQWSATLGAGVAGAPDYEGAGSYHARAVPLVSINYGDMFFFGPIGLGMNAINWNGFRAGPVLGYEGGRDQGDDPHLSGLGDISSSLTAGAFAVYRFGPFEISGLVRQAITHSRNGLTGLVQLDYRQAIIPGLDLIVGPDLEIANGTHDRTWFGVSSTQSAQSGLSVYTAGGGVKDVGLHASLTYRYSEHIYLRAFGAVREFTGGVADSPIVQNKTALVIGMGAAYHF